MRLTLCHIAGIQSFQLHDLEHLLTQGIGTHSSDIGHHTVGQITLQIHRGIKGITGKAFIQGIRIQWRELYHALTND